MCPKVRIKVKPGKQYIRFWTNNYGCNMSEEHLVGSVRSHDILESLVEVCEKIQGSKADNIKNNKSHSVARS